MIIGLAGKAGAGKSYIAQHLLVPDGFLPLSLGGPMKSILMGQGVIPFEEAVGKVSKSARSRHILQLYGTELGREVHGANIWTTTLSWWVEWFKDRGYRNVVIDDVRFRDEVQWIYEQGGCVLRVVGRGHDLGAAASVHASENDIDLLDLPEIDNSRDHDLTDTYQEILEAIDRHYS